MARGGVEPPLPPYQSDMLPLQHRAGAGDRLSAFVSPARLTFVPIGKVGIEPTVSCSQGTRVTITLHPGKVLTSSSGNRTPLSALKGQDPGR